MFYSISYSKEFKNLARTNKKFNKEITLVITLLFQDPFNKRLNTKRSRDRGFEYYYESGLTKNVRIYWRMYGEGIRLYSLRVNYT